MTVNPKTDLTVQPWSPATPPAPQPATRQIDPPAGALPVHLDVAPTSDPQIDYLLREVTRLRSTIAALTVASLQAVDAAPLTPLNGMLRYATGGWGEALGDEGPYVHSNGQWESLEHGLSGGVVLMIPRRLQSPASAVGWRVFGPNGEIVSTAGTVTQGLQEAINYAATNGFNLHVSGANANRTWPVGNQPEVILCSDTVVFPAFRQVSITFDAVNLTITPSNPAKDGVTIDSLMGARLSFDGQIVYSGNGYAVRFRPENPVFGDNITAIIDSTIDLQAVVTVGGTPIGVVTFDTSIGGISENFIRLGEINGAGFSGGISTPLCPYGIRVFDTAVGTTFLGNVIDVGHIHQFTSQVGLAVGSTASPHNIVGNVWRIGSIKPNGSAATTTAISTWATDDIYQVGDISNDEGAYANGIVLQSSSSNNLLLIGRCAGASVSNVVDVGARNDYRLNGGWTINSQIKGTDFYSKNAAAIGHSSVSITGGPVVNSPTLTSGPVNGNPTKWLPYDDNGTIRHIPSW